MTPTKQPLSWFIERIGKTVVMAISGEEAPMPVENKTQAKLLHEWQRGDEIAFRDPHPLTSSILTCSVISCDTCGKVGTTEDLDKEVAAKGFEGEGWKRLMDGTINCGCGE